MTKQERGQKSALAHLGDLQRGAQALHHNEGCEALASMPDQRRNPQALLCDAWCNAALIQRHDKRGALALSGYQEGVLLCPVGTFLPIFYHVLRRLSL
ncbi:hypothetical protein HAX54_051870 [Datura stramonium]|uniref:Uncharacterized protein n=1 Tax=Datura stramonium TaxID=4076 RepID=A0ABS8WRV2_DATST|nr:hypothetical protein [Datura stramonium]